MDVLSVLLDFPQLNSPIPFFSLDPSPIPFLGSRVHAGFPSPAEDYIETGLDLNELIVRHPAATFFLRVDGNSMINAGIHDGDIVVVDRALPPRDKAVIVAEIQGEFAVKRLRMKNDLIVLVAENPEYQPIEVTPEMDFEVWGVVTYVLHQVR